MRGTTNHYADFSYDSAGNVVADDLRSFTYDRLGKVTRTIVQDRDFRFLYAPGGERVAAIERKNTAGGIANQTTFTVRGFDNQLLSVFKTDTNGVAHWAEDIIWRGNAMLAHDTAATGPRHYALDHLGSPRLITTATTALPVGTQSFAPFGEGGTSDAGALQFTAHERDSALFANGLATLPDYMHARYYDMGTGRFLAVDPGIDWDPAKPQSWNMYSYVRNNPLNLVDPNGRQAAPPRACDYGQRCGAAALIQQAMRDDAQADWNAGAGAFRTLTPGNRASRKQVEDAEATLTGLAIKYVLPFLVPGEGTAVNLAENAAKGEVLAALRGGAGTMTAAQRAATIRQVGRATTNESVTVVQNANGTVNVLRTRPGVDGSQTFNTQVGRAGNTQTVQTAQNAAGEQVHYDPKGGTSMFRVILDWFR